MKLRHYTIIATLALLAASCAHEESEVAQISDIQLAITAAFATPAADFAAAGVGVGDASSTENPAKSATKSTTTAFDSGDLLGLYAVKSGGELNAASNLINNHQLKVAESGAIVGDLLPAYYPDKSSSLDLFSYYPYQSGNATADALGVLVGIRTHQTDFSLLQASDLCYGRKLDAAPSAAPHPLQFRHSFAQLRLNFSLYGGCSAISAVKLLSIKDSAKLNLQTGLVTLLTSSVVDVVPFVGSLGNSADATNPLQFTAIIPAQSLSGACVEITLKDGTIYYYHATAPIALKASATNTLNLRIADKKVITTSGTPAITAWGVESTISNISESTDNAFTFYWSPAITSFGSIDKAFVTLTNPATKKSARIEVAAFVRDAISTAENVIFRFAITRTDAASIGYPVTIDKFELFNDGTAVHTLTDYYGRTVTRSGAHTFGTVTSIKLSPDGDWLNAANTAQSRAVTIATTGSTSWVASASPAGIGLSVSPASGTNSATATIKWAAQAVGSLARNGEVTFKTTPDGVVKVVNTSQLAGPAPTLTLALTDAIDNPIPAGGKQYKTTITSNTAWTASALTNVTLDKSKGAAGTTAVVVTVAATTSAAARAASVVFTTDAVPSKATASQTWSGSQAAATIVLDPAGDWTNAANTQQTKAIKVTTYGIDTWGAAATGTGLSVTTSGNSGGSATVTWAAQAVGATARSGSVKFSSGSATPITINTSQVAGPAPTLTLALTDAIDNPIPAGGKTYKATITSNHAWTASGQNNLTIDKSKGAAGTTAVVVTIAATTSAAARAASVVFTTDAVPSKASATQTWSGSQAAASIVLDPAGDWANAANTQQTKAIKVTTYGIGTWSAAATGTGLSVTGSGNSGGSATVTWAAQAVGATARNGTVKFSSGVATPITIATNQVAGPAPTVTLSATSPGVTIPAAGAVYTITVNSNFAWTASGQTNVTLDKTSGAVGATTVKITIAATNSASARAASVVFTTDAVPSRASATQTWSGSQAAAIIVLEPADNWANVANSWQQRVIKVTTYGIGTWTAAATGTGLSVTGSGSSGGSATVTWAAQAVGATARNGTVKFSSGSATPITIATNQLAGPAPTLTLSTTSPGQTVPNIGKAYAINVVSNFAWTASALTNVTLSPTTGSAGTTAVTITVPAAVAASTRTVSVKFTTNSVPSSASASQTWNGTQAAAPANAVRINNLWWSTMNVGASTPQGYGTRYNWNSARSICPAGWRLPTKDEFGTESQYGPWTQLGGINGRWFGPTSGWSSSNAIFFSAAGRLYSGSLTHVGTDGFYWASAEVNSNNAFAYSLGFNSSLVGPQNGNIKAIEFAIRCVSN